MIRDERGTIHGVNVRLQSGPDAAGLECWIFELDGESVPVLLPAGADIDEEVRRWLEQRREED